MPYDYFARMLLICGLTLTAPMAVGQTADAELPACKELEDLYIELGRLSGQIPTEAEINAAIYEANPTNEECQMMLSLFPPME